MDGMGGGIIPHRYRVSLFDYVGDFHDESRILCKNFLSNMYLDRHPADSIRHFIYIVQKRKGRFVNETVEANERIRGGSAVDISDSSNLL
jgi:hypothetical protein